MDIQVIMQNLMNLKGLVNQFDANKAQSFINDLKNTSPENMENFINMIKPIAGGTLSTLLQQAVTKLDPSTISQMQSLVSKIDANEIQSVLTNLSGAGAQGLMDKAKGMFGNILNQ